MLLRVSCFLTEQRKYETRSSNYGKCFWTTVVWLQKLIFFIANEVFIFTTGSHIQCVCTLRLYINWLPHRLATSWHHEFQGSIAYWVRPAATKQCCEDLEVAERILNLNKTKDFSESLVVPWCHPNEWKFKCTFRVDFQIIFSNPQSFETSQLFKSNNLYLTWEIKRS